MNFAEVSANDVRLRAKNHLPENPDFYRKIEKKIMLCMVRKC